MNKLASPLSCYFIVLCAVVLLPTCSAKADIEFPATTVDVGEVRAGSPLSHKFTFKNRGPEEIEITGIQSSCGCLTPHLSGRRYSRGEEGSVWVEINTLSPAPGPHTWQVKLVCRVGEVITEIPLQIKAQLVREIVVEPAAVNMYVDGPIQTEIRLTDLRPQPLSLLAMDTSAPALQVALDGEEQDGSGRLVRKITLQVKDDFPEGSHDVTLRLYTNDPSYREIKVPVTIVKRARPRLSATPSRVDLTTGPRSSQVRFILIRDRENKDVEVETVMADDPAISCQWAKGPGVMTTVKIKCDQNIQENDRQSIVRVQVVKPIRQSVLIPVVITHP